MDVLIKPVTNAAERSLFMEFPYKLYSNCTNWVPPLWISQKEILGEACSFWQKNTHMFFLAFEGNKLVGRIAAFLNQDYTRHLGSSDGFFGFLEAIDHDLVFQKLLIAAETFLSAQGCNRILGPVNPTIHHELGVLTKGFEHPPFFMLTYNQAYYDNCIQKSGYRKLKDFSAYKLNTADFQLTEKIARVKNLLQKRYALTIRMPRMNDFKNELRIFHEIYNNAFVDHWGFYPMDWDDFQFLGKDMRQVLDKEMVLILEMQGKPIGFLLSIPNLNKTLMKIPNGRLFPFGILKLLYYKSKIKSLRVITIAVRKEFQHLGIGSMLYPEIALRARQRGYTHTELSWVVEDNIPMNKVCQDVGGTVTKNYRLYEKIITV